MAFEPVTIGAMVGLAMALVRVIEKLIEKFTNKDDVSLKSLDSKLESHIVSEDRKIDAFAEAMSKMSSSQERACEALDRLEAKLEKTSDAVVETRLRVMSGRQE